MRPFLTMLTLLAMAGCTKAEDYGVIAGFDNVVCWVIGLLLSVWIWRRWGLRGIVSRNFEKEYKRDDELAYIHARVSALQTLTMAIAKASPQSDQIRANFIVGTEERRSALQSTPMTTERVEALMQPFEDCLSEWKS